MVWHVYSGLGPPVTTSEQENAHMDVPPGQSDQSNSLIYVIASLVLILLERRAFDRRPQVTAYKFYCQDGGGDICSGYRHDCEVGPRSVRLEVPLAGQKQIKSPVGREQAVPAHLPFLLHAIGQGSSPCQIFTN